MVACGGDGTVVWVIEELVAFRVNVASVVVCFLPFGTGNDYSVATGFGRSRCVTQRTCPRVSSASHTRDSKSASRSSSKQTCAKSTSGTLRSTRTT